MTTHSNGEWVEVREASAIISQNSGRPVSPDYVRLIAHQGRIKWKPKDERQNYYLRSDVEKIIIKQRKKKSVDTTGDSEKLVA